MSKSTAKNRVEKMLVFDPYSIGGFVVKDKPTDPWGKSEESCLVYKNYETERIISQLRIGKTFDNDHVYVAFSSIKFALNKLKALCAGDSEKAKHLQKTVDYIEDQIKDQLNSFNESLKKQEVSFDELWLLYNVDEPVYFVENETKIAGVVKDANYARLMFGGEYFKVTISYISYGSDGYCITNKSISVMPWDGTKKIGSLETKPIDKEMSFFQERGKKISGILGSHYYASYEGELIQRSWYGSQKYNASGRCMIDAKVFERVNSNYDDPYGDNEDDDFDEIEESQYFMINPWVKGFSFSTKMWGEFCFDNISELKFDDKAFDQLVLPPLEIDGSHIDQKNLIKSLVKRGGNTGFSDIISGKGGGCIFLLHGPPGVGKTLTAEAIAELVNKPLYSISVGELGTTTDTLEANLRQILDISTIWDAVVLIDEADIFLEERTTSDVQRNALVAIFLRVLEYFQGIMFLTTNRVKNFDRAFHSRISIALNYGELNKETRIKVWTNLLDAANVSNMDIDKLSSHELNGRQIKNAIRISMALAEEEGRDVSNQDVLNTILLSNEFSKVLNG